MPVSKEAWDRGWAPESIEVKIIEFLQAHSDEAYTSEEIGQAVNVPGLAEPASALQVVAQSHALGELETRLVALAVAGRIDFRYLTNEAGTSGTTYYRMCGGVR